IVLHEVYVEDSHPGQYPLLTARKISFQLNPLEVWGGNYAIKGMKIHDSETHLKINERGENNYTIIKKREGAADTQGTVSLALSNVSHYNTKVNYVDLRILHDFTFQSKNLTASILSERDVYDIEAEGHLATEKMMIGVNNYLNGKSFEIRS